MSIQRVSKSPRNDQTTPFKIHPRARIKVLPKEVAARGAAHDMQSQQDSHLLQALLYIKIESILRQSCNYCR